MIGAEFLDGLHDGCVESLTYEWQERKLELRLVGDKGAVVVRAGGVARVSWTNEAPWGESKTIYINEVGHRKTFGRDVIELLMSTGDRLLIEAKAIAVSIA